MTSITKDRLSKLLDSRTLNGIDYAKLEVGPHKDDDVVVLRVQFLNNVELKGTPHRATITGGNTIPTVPVLPIRVVDWGHDHNTKRPTVAVRVDQMTPWDSSEYTLTLIGDGVDPFFGAAIFTFDTDKNGVSNGKRGVRLPPEPSPPQIDYLAKDFQSFRQALFDFSAQRYPEWQERSEADFEVMFMEALSGLADDLSYTQDRIAAEAYLETATQRRSLVRLARLVDYEPGPWISSSVYLRIEVNENLPEKKAFLTAGLPMIANLPDGAMVNFETGTGLRDSSRYLVREQWNQISPHIWDDRQSILKAGATEMWIEGHGLELSPGSMVLIDTEIPDSGDPAIREIVTLVWVNQELDELYNKKRITHIAWRTDEALQWDHDLTATVVSGNVIPATQGITITEKFGIEYKAPGDNGIGNNWYTAFARIGPNNAPGLSNFQYLYSLQQSPIAWMAADPADPADPLMPTPEIQLVQTIGDEAHPSADPLELTWNWAGSLLAAQGCPRVFTLEPSRYSAAGSMTLATGDIQPIYDYDGDQGDTIKFGDGSFGASPEPNAEFQVTYRVGGGKVGNVAPDTITSFLPAPNLVTVVKSVTNPLAALGGQDMEPNDHVRLAAPFNYRATQLRSVRPEDYEAAAETLDWVVDARAAQRWTGSWFSYFTSIDPRSSERLTLLEQAEATRLLNARRLAGYESFVRSPLAVSYDLEIKVRALADDYRDEVKSALVTALNPGTAASPGFFWFDNFTFGVPLERSNLESALQKVVGVAGVVSIRCRRSGIQAKYRDLPPTIRLDRYAVLRIDNDPNRPANGLIQIIVEGGK